MTPTPPSPRPRIVDLVFDPPSRERRRFTLWALVFTGGGYLVGVLALAGWARAHPPPPAAAPPLELVVPIALPPPEPPPADSTAALAPAPAADPVPAPRRPRSSPPPAAKAAPPAAAGRVLEAPAEGPLDLRADTIVTGPASGYAGGAGAQAGGTGAPGPATADGAAAAGRARSVGLVDPDWRCAWPAQAAASDKEREEVPIRVVVDAGGRPLAARALRDPGGGFAAAAVACAMTTRFVPARGQDGRPHQAESPPIRVVFTR
jgi:periplasmic protein TonB